MPKFTFTSPNGEEYELEGPEGSTREQAFSILQEGIKTGYYKPKSTAKATIPGQEGEEQRVAALQAQRKAKPGSEQLTDILKGAGETALNLGTGFFAGVQAPIAAGIKRATGMVPDWEKETARLMEEQTYSPKTEKGQDYAANVGEFINRYIAPLGPGNLSGLAQPRPIGALRKPQIEKAAQPSEGLAAKLAEKEAQAKAAEQAPISDFEAAARAEAERRYRNDQTVARLEAAIEKQNPEQPLMRADVEGNVWTKDNQLVQDKINELQFNRDKQQAAQMLLEERQRALEEQVRQQQQLDFNAAERARQEAASTGLEQHQETLRQQAEQRLPGDNTPLDFTKENAPYNLQDTPYQYKGAIDAGPFLAEQHALVVDKQIQQGEAWRQRAIERQTEQDAVAKQEQRIQELEDTLMPLEEQLRAQQYTPDLQGQGPKTRNFNRFGQGGGIDPQVFEDIVNFGKKLIPRKALPDNINTPRSTENIAAREAKRAKAKLINSDVYQQITTKEEALTNPGKDISRITQEAGAGVGGAVRRNPTNKPLKYARYLLDTATNDMNAFIKQYVTGENSFNITHSKLSKQDKVDVYHLKNWLSEKQIDYTPELGKELGLSAAAQKHMEASQKAYAEIARRSAEMNLEKGLEPFVPRKGYFPSIWDGGFRALVGEKYIRKDGSEGFRITDVISTKSRKEFNDAKNYYKGKDIIDLGRTGLRQQTHGRFGKRDDIAFLLNALAEDDSKFGDLKEKLKTANAISHKDYLGFGVHELDKKGVGGYKGKKPWLSEAENMKEALEAEIQYFDQAAKYISGQKLLDDVHDIVTELRLKGEMPNTAAYLDKYMDHITGKGMQPTAAAINQVVDAGTTALGKIANKMGVKMPENPRAAAQAVGTVGNALLMNIVNFPMFATQLAQLYQAGAPELIRAQQQYGLHPAAWATSFARGHIYLPLEPILNLIGMPNIIKIPEHMKEARKWMKDHGMDDFSEVMLSQDILESKTTRNIKKAAFWPTVLPEKFTRPTFFMSMVDLFHQAGFETKEAIMRAKAATDYTMTDYRPEEAPLMYDRMGVLAPETSALQKYKHNALDQWASRMREAPENKLAFVTFMGLSIALGGVLGLPMMQEMDEIVIKPLTKALGKEQSARELLMTALGSDSKALDGLASAYTGFDIGSRFSLADVAPNSFGEAVAGARLSKMFKIAATGYDFAKNQDEQSLKQFGKELVPSGVAQLYNEAFMANDKGQLLNKKGQIATGVERGEFPSRYAISNFRPLQEKVEGELNYTKNQRLVEIQDKQKTASERMKIALLNKDKAGFQRHLQKYQENYGDLNNIQSIIDDAVKKGYITEKQRLEGTPKQSPMSIKRYQEMQR